MKDSAKYVKIVEWSEEDQCYVGSAPGLIYAGCHGPDEQRVFEELCQIVEEGLLPAAAPVAHCRKPVPVGHSAGNRRTALHGHRLRPAWRHRHI